MYLLVVTTEAKGEKLITMLLIEFFMFQAR